MPTAEQLFDDWAVAGKAEGMEQGHRPRALHALGRIPLASGDRTLDLGCGNGWATRWLHQRVAPGGTATGVDLAVHMLERARSQEMPPGLAFERAAFEALPFADGALDHAWSMEALYYAPDLQIALKETHRVLRVGGTLTVCTDFYLENPDSHSWPTDLDVHMVLLGREGWSKALENAGFTVLEVFQCPDPRSPDDPGSLALRGRK